MANWPPHFDQVFSSKTNEIVEIPPEISEIGFARLDDIAMHKGKIREIEGALTEPNRPTLNRIVLVSGPSGSSKGTVVRFLASKLGKRLIEWQNPDDLSMSYPISDAFGDFLVGASLRNPEMFIVYVKELPNLYHEDTLLKFRKALSYYLSLESAPQMIIVFTEIFSVDNIQSLTVRRVFGDLLSDEKLCWIKTNPVNATEISRVLKRFAEHQLGLKTRHVRELKRVISELSSKGDIQSAIQMLRFWSLGHQSTQTFFRDSKTDIFQSIGRAIYGSKKVDMLGILTLAEENCRESEIFNLALLENYHAGFRGGSMAIGIASDCSEWLSLADISIPVLGCLGLRTTLASVQTNVKSKGQFSRLRLPSSRSRQIELAKKIKSIQDYKNKQRLNANWINIEQALDQDAFPLKQMDVHADIYYTSESENSSCESVE